jgi:hypothetical protein
MLNQEFAVHVCRSQDDVDSIASLNIAVSARLLAQPAIDETKVCPCKRSRQVFLVPSYVDGYSARWRSTTTRPQYHPSLEKPVCT